MAIVNRTPDSFHDRGATFALDRAVEAALAAVADGADWVDIGGVPFGRGPVVSVEEELDRVVPVVEAVAAASDVVISVDTVTARVAEAAIAAGAGVINDTSGLYDPDMASVVAASDATLVLTHSLTPPRDGPRRPEYTDVVAEVVDFLRERVARAVEAGVSAERLVVDPGHDLNKNTRHTLELTRGWTRWWRWAAHARRALEQGLHRREPRARAERPARRVARRGGVLRHEGCADRAGARRARDGRRDADDRGDPRLARPRLREAQPLAYDPGLDVRRRGLDTRAAARRACRPPDWAAVAAEVPPLRVIE